MTSEEAREPLLSTSLNTSGKRSLNLPKSKRRLRRSKSAPLVDSSITGSGTKDPGTGTGSIYRAGSIFRKLHPSFRKVALYLTAYLGIGALCFYPVGREIKGLKTNGIVDAVYFTIVTMTTVGYGDLVPNSATTKLLACAFVFTGMALVGLTLSKAADYLVEKQEMLLFEAFHADENVSPRDIMKEINTNRAKYKCLVVFILLLVLIISGTIFLIFVEKLEIIDAFYCVCSTITTLGYGDKSFSTMWGRVFAIFWILIGTISMAQFFLYIAELKTERRQSSLVKWVLSRKMTHVDLEAADLDEDGVVGPAEFVLYKLREMGKICQDDILLVMEEFENLDVDQSGTISISDIRLAQSS